MKKIALVLGGGGMRGMAHIGVLKSLKKRGIVIDHYIGASVGALISGFAAAGIPVRMIERVAKRVKKEDILEFKISAILRQGLRVGWIYRGKQFENFLRKNLPVHSFDELKTPLYINSVNLNSGALTYWGLPSFRDVPLEEAIYASCAFPIVFRPKKIKNEYYIDGGVIDNLPIRVTRYTKPDHIIAVNLRYRGSLSGKHIEKKGAIALLDQITSIMGQMMTDYNIHQHQQLPITIIHPKVEEYDFLDFNNIEELINEGERAADEVLDKHPLFGTKKKGRKLFGLFHRKKPIYKVTQNLCTGCANCIIRCPVDLYKINNDKSEYQIADRERCTACFECIKNCSYHAISFMKEKDTFSLNHLFGKYSKMF